MIGLWQRATVQLGKRKWGSLKFPLLNGNTDRCCCASFQTWRTLWNHTIGPGLLWPNSLPILCSLFKNWGAIGIGRINLSPCTIMSVTRFGSWYTIHLWFIWIIPGLPPALFSRCIHVKRFMLSNLICHPSTACAQYAELSADMCVIFSDVT